MKTLDSAAVTRGIESWLREEIANADSGRNGYLSDYDTRRAEFALPFDDPANFGASKALGHHRRFRTWLEAYGSDDMHHEDQLTARIIFGCLMNVSGAYRDQCFMQAANEAEYTATRRSESTGIDIGQAVIQNLNSTVQREPGNDLDDLMRTSYNVNDISLELTRNYREACASDYKPTGQLADPGSPTVQYAVARQRLWTGLAAAHIGFAAAMRDDDLSKVPLLEPQSITDGNGLIFPYQSL